MGKIIYNKFDSMRAFSSYLAGRVPCGAFSGVSEKRLSSIDTDPDYVEFSGTKDFATADDLLKYGDKESFKKLSSGRVNVGEGGGATTETFHNVVGCAVDMGAYFAGSPACMIDIRETYKGAQTIKVLYSSSIGCGCTTSEISDVANKFFNAIKKIEESGIDVELYVGSASKDGSEIAAFSVLLKKECEQISLYKCAYPIINPSFNRRHAFRFREVCGVKNSGWVDGYGHALTSRAEMERVFNMPCFNYYSCEKLSVDDIIKEILKGLEK